MPETRELRTVLDAGEQAAAEGDYASAWEHLLREAALLQEARLGPVHPDLANTLNNLGVVCENTDKPADAELCYRKAFAIATAVLEPDHPFVATSRKNLTDFCEARGKPVADDPKPPATETAGPLLRERPSRAPSRRLVSVRSSRSVAIAVLGVCGLALLMFIEIRRWSGSNREAESQQGARFKHRRVQLRRQNFRARRADPHACGDRDYHCRPCGVSAAALAQHRPRRRRQWPTRSSAGIFPPADCAARPVTGGAIIRAFPLIRARCFFTRASGPQAIQRFSIAGIAETSCARSSSFRFVPVRTEGYRTYSRNTVDQQSTGDWRVELRTNDGILLHEERFAVR